MGRTSARQVVSCAVPIVWRGKQRRLLPGGAGSLGQDSLWLMCALADFTLLVVTVPGSLREVFLSFYIGPLMLSHPREYFPFQVPSVRPAGRS